ncbi:MAG: PAS domain S-box protein [Deferrisomatales bacterium]|nr:PAS domain S-box protein [Deferrisomatales bacterium]
MRFNPYLPLGQGGAIAAFNALLLAAILVPGLYLLLFRPLERTVTRCRAAEAALQSAEGEADLRWAPLFQASPYFLSPLWLTGVTAVSVFAAELAVMRAVPFLAEAHPWPDAVLDALFLVLLLTPVLYLALFRPLSRTLDECQRIERALRRAGDRMESRVREGGAELARTNEALRAQIEERARVEQELRRSEERYHLLVESMNEGFCVADGDGAFTYVNKRFSEMVGRPSQELLQLRAEDLVADASRPVLREQLERRRRGEKGVYQVFLRAGDDRCLPVLVSSTPLLGEDRSFQGSFAVITDISDLKNTEEELLYWRSYLQALSSQLLTAQERERERVARELHDGIGQTLAAVKFQIETACADGAVRRELLDGVVARLQGAVEEVRRIGMALRPSLLDDLGLLATIGWFSREFRETYPGVSLESRVNLQEADVPEPLKIVVFRVLQEALNNVAKHSGAGSVRVRFEKAEGELRLEVEDDGVGFDVKGAVSLRSTRRSLGLDSMRERTQLAGGRFWVDSAPGGGTRVQASWPVTAAARGVHGVSEAGGG